MCCTVRIYTGTTTKKTGWATGLLAFHPLVCGIKVDRRASTWHHMQSKKWFHGLTLWPDPYVALLLAS